MSAQIIENSGKAEFAVSPYRIVDLDQGNQVSLRRKCPDDCFF